MPSVLRSSPPVEVPNATSRPSTDGAYQSSAAVGSPVRAWGSTSVRGRDAVAVQVAHTSAACSRRSQRSIENSRPPPDRRRPRGAGREQRGVALDQSLTTGIGVEHPPGCALLASTQRGSRGASPSSSQR